MTVGDFRKPRWPGAELRVRTDQKTVVAEFGQRALAGTDLYVLMDEAVVRMDPWKIA